MKEPDEEVHRARYVRRGVELPCLLWAPHPPSISVCSCSLAWKLSTPPTLGIFMEVSSHRHDQLLTQSPTPFLSEEGGVGLKIPSF